MTKTRVLGATVAALALTAAGAVPALASPGQEAVDLTTSTADALAQQLVSGDLAISNVTFTGNAAQAVPPPPVAAQTNVPAAVTQAVVLNPTPADEQRRLDAVAAEVARRRALREQASQQMGQGVPPAGAAPQAMPLPAPIPGAPPQQGYVSPTTQFGTRGRGPIPVSPR